MEKYGLIIFQVIPLVYNSLSIHKTLVDTVYTVNN
jgi:hypothetical protein